ncbi:MAG TPA: MraY family glycosyltransferase [Actinomycetota bacterium]|nr:MraY family glycosyltransferase [Actinomycetota bacterium]
MGSYLTVFLASAATTFVATPVVRRLAVSIGSIARPNDRTVHAVPTPTMGGLAMFFGFLVGMGIAFELSFFDDLHRGTPIPLAAVATCTLMVGLGLIDDRRGTSALAKFTAQVFIAGVLVLMGAALTYIWIPGFEVVSLSQDIAVPLTILWVVAIANAVNLVDGLDGLAAGMIAIAAAAFFVYIIRTPSTFGDASAAALLSAIAVGMCLGFLPWNFHPARIFMGDSGALLLGMLLSIATIDGVGRNPFEPSGGDIAAIAGVLVVPLLVLFIPFLDVVLAIARRTWRGQGIGHADKEHIHHRLMEIGHSHRRAVLLMYLWSALISGSALAVGLIDGRATVGLILLAALALFLVTALPALDRWRRRGNGPSAPEGARRSVGQSTGSATGPEPSS